MSEQFTPQSTEPTSTPSAPNSNGLGEAGIRALQAERDRANQLEAELKSFRGKSSQLETELSQKYQQEIEGHQLLFKQDLENVKSQYQQQLEAIAKEKADYQAQLQAFQAEKVTNKITGDFTKAIASDLVDESFMGLLLNDAASYLALDDKGNTVVQTADGVFGLDALKQHYQKQYPQMFRSPANSKQGVGVSGRAGMPAQNNGRVKTVSRSDNAAFLANLDAIARGEVQVVD